MSAFAVASCETLEVKKEFANKTDQSPEIDAAPLKDRFIYALPETEITVTGTVALNDCDGTVVAPPDGEQAPPVDVSETFTVASSAIADPTKQYGIPYAKLGNWAKGLSLSVGTYANKALQNINGTITDQSGPIAISAVQAIVGIGVAGTIPSASVLPKLTGAELRANKVFFATLPSKKQKILLSLDSREARSPAEFASLLGGDDKSLRRAISNDLTKLAASKEVRVHYAAGTSHCTDDVVKALHKIKKLNDDIRQLVKATVKDPNSTIATLAPSTNDPQLLHDQAEIQEIIANYHLSRTIVATWIPTRNDVKDVSVSGTPLNPNPATQKLIILQKNIKVLEGVIASWLTPDGLSDVQQSTDPAAQRVRQPLVLSLQVQSWSLGRDYSDTPLAGGSPIAAEDPEPDGIMVRDPALSVLRTCLGQCNGHLKGDGSADAISTDDDIQNQFKAGGADLIAMDTSNDLAPALTVPLPQLGRFEVLPLKNGVFQTSSISVALNSDSTISTMSNQSANAIAGSTGLGAVTTTAATVTGGIGSKNTAIAAENTATLSALSYADTVNKNQADCLAQMKLILAAGRRPNATCP